ncbi:SusD/RagB family nutrient-binding outer membrane lipoprotein [Zobellia nedashkovskayae]|uniref:SusD/RagB family nutrient-binding outer membrane lipoprotein n=1 Tax=Zobellia nedashkovskayae TaxID=2779510 RepID=UPI001D05A29E|nr:SusD/RagB family nutrient-binding outer membrane lipoprotein [Zobellia nedashkovskayae]
MKNISLFLVMVLLFASCTGDFEETNTDPLAFAIPDIVESELLQGQAFAQAQYTSMFGENWRYQIAQNLFADIWCQYFATTASGFDSDRYIQVGNWADLAWSSFYVQSLPQIILVEDATEETGNAVGNAMIKIWKVNAFHRMTDYWGPIPYLEVGNTELEAIPYDSQEDIYRSFFVTLDEAVAQLEANLDQVSFTAGDRTYGGDAGKWLKFANSLRLRLAIRVKYVDPVLSQTEAEKAVAAGVFLTNDDNAYVSVDEVNRNPLESITDWGEFRMSATMESILEGYEDPRLASYFTPAVDGDSDGDGSAYEGLLNGQTKVTLETSQNDSHSDMATLYIDTALGGINPPMEVMTAAEVYFLRAEGALEGWAMGGSAEELYEMGISTSMEDREAGDPVSIAAYIASSNTPSAYEAGAEPISDIPVAFSADPETQLEQIITQKWIAIYPNGWEAWAELRRTGYPKQYARAQSDNSDVAADEIMRRMVYVSAQFDTNSESVNAAIAGPELNGADLNSTKLWWDKK